MHKTCILITSLICYINMCRDFETECLVSFRNRMFSRYFMTIISSGGITLNELQEIVCKYIAESRQEIKTPAYNCKLKPFSDLKQLRFSGKNTT